MAIEFRCTGCQQQLRVPDESAGKSAKCPKCGAVVPVPVAQAPAAGFGFPSAPPPPPPPQPQFQPASPFAAKPFGANPAAGASPFGGGAGSAPPNPYASPQAASYQPAAQLPGGPIVNQVISVEQVFNYAWQIWQVNLGLLVGATFVLFIITNGVSYALQGVEFALQQNDAPEAAIGVSILRIVLGFVIQTFLGIGYAQIMLKLSRRQPAEFGDLFGGGPLFLPVFAATLLAVAVVIPAYLLLIVPGVILSLMFWPFSYLIIERKAGIIESFSMAAVITKNNWGTAFVLALLGFGINILGCLALCVGVLFSTPLVAMMFAVAYLMMSGQLSPYGQSLGPQMAGQFPQQPMPGKW